MVHKILDILMALTLIFVSFTIISIFLVIHIIELIIKWGKQCRDYFMGK